MAKATLIIVLALLLAVYGCESGNKTTVTNVTPEPNQTQPAAAPVNTTPAAANETVQQPEDEQTIPSPYTLAQLSEFLPNMKFLIGADAPSSDVIAVTNIKSFLIYENVTTGEPKLTSEVDNYKRGDYIIVGSPCSNPAAADLFKADVAKKGSCRIFPDGEGVIKLKAVSNNHFMLYVGGNTPAETKKAATALQYFGNYTLSGTEARVRGSAESPVVAVVG